MSAEQTQTLYNQVLRKVDEEWIALFDHEKLRAAIAGIVEAGDDENITPPAELVFEALRYGAPSDYDVVIIGQDPYPTPGEAQGLCFSIPGDVEMPQSLQRIFGCLDRAGLRKAHLAKDEEKDVISDSGDLRSWAVQGVLMLNAALTTRVKARRAHAGLWKPFVDDLIKKFCAAREGGEHPVHFMLWGGDARKYAKVARAHGHNVFERTHPSPMADNKLPPEGRFRECTHFNDVNDARVAVGRRPVKWDNLAPVVAFSDGSCSNNGKPDARASYAAVLIGGPFGKSILRGEVAPMEYELLHDAVPEQGLHTRGGTLVAPSNNRGEYLGFIYCMIGAIRGRALGRVEIISDSKITVQTMLEWLPNRLKKGTERGLKNFDLVMVAWELLKRLRAQAASVVITHTNSHKPKPPPSASDRERLIWGGNDQADKHAAEALPSEPDYSVVVMDAPPVLQMLGDYD